MGELTLSELERIQGLEDAERTFQMDEEAFRTFYEQTSRPVWLYLCRVTGDERLAEDLLQETYYRFLRSAATFENEEHRRHYLFRVATNLVRDSRRRTRTAQAADDTLAPPRVDAGAVAAQRDRGIDLRRAMRRLKTRERAMLWLAYAQGWSHAEIASALGVKQASLKALLHRARQRLLRLMGQDGGRR